MSVAVARIGRRRRLAIDLPAALNLVGTLLKYLGLAAVFPIPFALGYGETVLPFVVAGVVTSGAGVALERATGRASGRVGVREGFLVVALVWLLAAAFAGIPYLFEGGDQLSSPLDAYFEGMSGFTTTGASVVTDFSALNRSLGIWRQYTQWLGGLAVLVLAIAVLPRLRVGGRQLMESELPGTEITALAERIRSTARKLWLLYAGLTVLETLALAIPLGGRDRRRDDAVPGAGVRLLDDADRRLLDPAGIGPGALGRGAVDPRALHGRRRRELRAHVPRARPPSPARARARRGVPPVRRAVAGRGRDPHGDAVGLRNGNGRGGGPEAARSRRSR